MATTVGEIAIDIRAKVEGLATDINKGKSVVTRGMKDMQGAANALQGVIAAVGVGAFAGYIKSAIDAGGALADLSQKTGVSASQLSALEYAAKMSGTTIEGVAGGLKKLGTNMYATAQGAGSAGDAFKALGIGVTDSSGKLRSSHDVMLDVATQFSGMQNGAEKTALAVKLFGKSGADLIPMLNEGADGIKELEGTAAALGLTLTDDAAAGMESLGDSLDTIEMAGGGLARQLAVALTPAIQAVSQVLIKAATNGGGLQAVIKLIAGGFKALVTVVHAVVGVFDAFARVAIDWFGGFAKLVTGDFAGARDSFKSISGDMAAAFAESGEKIEKVWADQAEAQKPVTAGLGAMEGATEDATIATGAQVDKVADVIKKLDDERAMLGLDSTAQAVYKAQVDAGVTANSEAGIEIGKKVIQLTADRDMTDAAKKATEDANKAIADHITAVGNETQALTDKVRKAEDEVEEIGLTTAGIEHLNLARLKEKQSLIDAAIASGGMTAERRAEKEAIDEQIRLQGELIGLVEKKGVAEAQTKQAEDAQKAWEESSRQIEQALTDSLMRGFESGASMVDSLKNYLINAFKTTVVKFGVDAIMGGIGSVIPGLGRAGGGEGATSYASMVSGIGSLWSGGKSLWGSYQAGGMAGLFGGADAALGGAYNSAFQGAVGAGWTGPATNAPMSYQAGNAGFGAGAMGWAALVMGVIRTMTDLKDGMYNVKDVLTGRSLEIKYEDMLNSKIDGLGTLLFKTMNPLSYVFDRSQAQWGKLGVQVGGTLDEDAERTVIAASGLTLSAVSKRTDSEAAGQMLDSFLAADEALTQVARAAGIIVDFTGKSFGSTSLSVDHDGALNAFGAAGRLDKLGNLDLSTSTDQFARAWIETIAEQLPNRVREFMKAQDLDATAEQLVASFSFIADIDRLLSLDVVGNAKAVQAAIEAPVTMLAAYASASDKVRELSAEFDGSAASMIALTEALAAQKTIAAQMAAAYEELGARISGLFLATIEEIKRSLQTPEEQFATQRAALDVAIGELRGSIDPVEIATLSGQIDNLVKSLWGMLSKDEQAAQGQLWIDLLNGANTIATEQLAIGKEALKASEAALTGTVDANLLAFAEGLTGLGATLETQSQAAADQTVFAIGTVNSSVQSGTTAVVQAVAGITATVAAAVAQSAAASTAAIIALAVRLDRTESSNRLEGARP